MIKGAQRIQKRHECNEIRCYGWQGKRKMQNMWKKMHAKGSELIERCQDAIEPTSMDWEAVEKLSRRQKLSRWIEKLSKSYQDCNKEKLKNLDRSPSYWEGVKIAIKGRWKAR